MTKILIDRAVVEQALHVATGAGYPLALIAALKTALAEPVQEPVQELPWLRAIDEAMIDHHVGVADPADDYETAKRKLNNLLCHAQDIGAYFAKQAEPVQEPIGFANANHLQRLALGLYDYAEIYTDDSAGRIPVYAAPQRPAEPVQEPDDKAASIRWQLCLLAQTEEFSDEVRNQIGRGVWLIDRLTEAALAEPVQEAVQEPATLPGPGLVMCPACCAQFDPALNSVQPVQEPVGAVLVNRESREGVMFYSVDMIPDPSTLKDCFELVPVYTSPPQRKPLTEEEIFAIENDIPDDVIGDRAWTIWLSRAVERAHKIGGEG